MSYPKNLSYAVNRLSGYSTQLVKVRVNQGDKAKAGDVISFDLPYNSIVNLDSLRFCFKVTVTGGNAAFRHTEGFVRQAMWESGGQLISSGFDHTPVLWNIHNDLFAGDKISSRQLYQRGGEIGSVAAVTNEEAYVSTFFGLQTAVPQYIDTSLFPNGSIRLSLRLADVGTVFIGATSSIVYELNDLYLLVQTVDIQDGLYYAVLNERLKAGDIEMPFTNIYNFNGGNRSGESFDLQFSLSSQSVNLLYGTALLSSSMVGVGTQANTIVKNTPYYSRGSASGSKPLVQWFVNNQSFPSYGQMTAKDAHSETLNAMGLLQDAVGAMNPLMDSATKWEQNFYVSAVRLNHNDGDANSTLVSGLNALGTNGVGLFKWSQTGSETLTPMVFVSTTAVIRLGAGRTMAITY